MVDWLKTGSLYVARAGFKLACGFLAIVSHAVMNVGIC
jgi:hypothetical protein